MVRWGVIKTDDLGRGGEQLVGKVPDLCGAVAEHDELADVLAAARKRLQPSLAVNFLPVRFRAHRFTAGVLPFESAAGRAVIQSAVRRSHSTAVPGDEHLGVLALGVLFAAG